MIVEFIINKIAFKKFLKDEFFTAKNGIKVDHSIAKVKGKENYFLILICESSLVASAEALSELRIKLENIFKENGIKYRLLTEGASQFFTNKLYPLACEFETKLRKFIYTSLIDIDDKAEKEVVDKFKKTLLKNGEDKNFDKLPQDDFLAKKDFGQIFDFLFSNDEFLAQVKKINEPHEKYDRRLTKKDLLKKIGELPEQTVWNLLFAPSFCDSKLPKIYNDIQHYRNDIMHLHNISYADYKKALAIFKTGIKDLNYQIDKGIVIEVTDNNVQTLTRSSNYVDTIIQLRKLTEPILDSIKSIQDLGYDRYLKSLSTILPPDSQIFKQLSDLQKQVQMMTPISDLQKKLNIISAYNILSDAIAEQDIIVEDESEHIKNEDEKK